MAWIKYATNTKPINLAGNITLDRWSNGLTIKNTGNSVLLFNQDPLQPGQSKAIGGNYGELLTGRYAVAFAPIASPPPGYVQSNGGIVTEKYYLPTPEQMKKLDC